MAELGGGIALVVGQKDQHILVSLPLAGCPPGFQLRAGERVVVVNEADGLSARPLIVTRRAKLSAQDLADTSTVNVAGERHPVQAASQLGWSSAEGKPAEPGEYDVFLVDSETAEGPRQVIASRAVNPAAGKQ